MKPILGITMGDPAGIGPEIILKALRRPDVRRLASFVLYGDHVQLSYVSRRVFHRSFKPGFLLIDFSARSSRPIALGRVSKSAGHLSGLFIDRAVQDALAGRIDAVVTAPINKESFRLGGWGEKFVGHTEMLATLTRSRSVALMLVHGSLRAVHVTQHIPLRDVSRSLSTARVFETIRLAHTGLVQMGVRRPRIAVCGLNPHAGENGLLGREEKTKIFPAIKKARRLGISVTGPLSADAVWPAVLAGRYDVGVAMYHDQGQIPLKLQSFSYGKQVNGINVTLGLPIVRTSVAHGTAYELAGKGTASEESLVDAIQMAVQMVKRK